MVSTSIKLLDESPLLILPSLATEIGLNESVMLQQMHYWLLKSNKYFDGKAWFYKTLEEWEKEFPFWSQSTIRRVIGSLEKMNLILVGNFNQKKFDKTKWYTINYERVNSPCVQNEQTYCSDWTEACVQNEQTYTIEYTENTTENNINNSTDCSTVEKNKEKIPKEHIQVIDYLNEKVGTKFKATNKLTQKHLTRLFKEGYTVEEIIKTIDFNCKRWNNPEFRGNLNPNTLFRLEKFELYINMLPQKPVNQPKKESQTFEEFARKTYGENWRAIVDEST